MNKLLPCTHADGHYLFMCPGCGEYHKVGPDWAFNGNLESPTFTPSVLVRNGHYWPHHAENNDTCWCTYNADQVAKGEPESKYKCYLCHSFITDGKIQFLSDCTHALAGQTVSLPNVEIEEKTP